MRILALSVLLGALGLSFPCAAQAAPADTNPLQTSSIPKQAPVNVPQRLAPAEAAPTGTAPVQAYASPPLPAVANPQQAEAPPPQPAPSFATPDRLLDWAYNYHKHPTPSRLPAAVRAMRELGLFADEEKGAFCTGFIAG